MKPVKEEVWGLDDNHIPDMKMMLVSEDVRLEVDYVLEDVFEDYISQVSALRDDMVTARSAIND